MNYTIEDIGLSYRKAKVDLYYSSHASLQSIADYEKNIVNNLQTLLQKINGSDELWVKEAAFLGSWTLAPKAIKVNSQKVGAVPEGIPFCASPDEKWNASLKNGVPMAEFRLMAQCSLDFHVLSALWILKVGHKYDSVLSDCSYGNRLRRGQDKQFNHLSLGSFIPYLKPFRDWRDGGINAMRSALEGKKNVIALTADVTGFYHELNPSFMLDEGFKNEIGLQLSDDEDKLNRLFITALEAWAKNTPLGKGLPVGLPASAIVANMALIELDRLIEQQVVPLFYGRYVDDILLVMENGSKIKTTQTLWEWLFDRSNNLLSWASENQTNEIQFNPTYLGNSKVYFENDKNKVFLLEGETGKTLVDSIAHQIHVRASEWRSLPNMPESASHVATDMVAATQHDGQTADNLRKTDDLTMRRAGFAIKLRDFEAYERDLRPEAWKEHRQAFFRAFCQHVIVLPCFFELAIYLPRVVKLATSCEDFDSLNEIVLRLKMLYTAVAKSCELKLKSCPKDNELSPDEILDQWRNQLFSSVQECIIASFPPRLSKAGHAAWQEHMVNSKSGLTISKLPVKVIQAKQAVLFSHDLAHQPFRFIALPKEMVAQRGIPSKKTISVLQDFSILPKKEIIEGISILSRWIKFMNGMPLGLLFATRPLNLYEVFILAKEPYEEDSQYELKKVVLALRGFELGEKTPRLDKKGVLKIPDGKDSGALAIAVSSWKTDHQSWVASVMRMPDPDAFRYRRLTNLINNLMSLPGRPRYFVLPELALPAHWFVRIALKLQGRGICLISGIEYIHEKKRRVRSQVWAALSHDGLGFPAMMIYRQDKQRPALHEELDLKRLAGAELKPAKPWPHARPPVIQHGEFRFSMLVCSELTNIAYRAALRGSVDALFVPEWNQDTETFNALVESAALDIHAYIIQCNDRNFGDSRIRSPNKDSWHRDVLRVKGGIDDYCVTGVIDIKALREFQSGHRSPLAPFKPVPDGFQIAHERKVLPKE